MEVFRISKAIFANQLISSGKANRWNREGEFVIYTGSSRALAVVESIAHRAFINPALPYKTMVISVADDIAPITEIYTKDLPANWQSLLGYTALQKIGSAWYTSQRSLVLKVPSAVIPHEHNYIINTEHPDFNSNVQLVKTEDFDWDNRLL